MHYLLLTLSFVLFMFHAQAQGIKSEHISTLLSQYFNVVQQSGSIDAQNRIEFQRDFTGLFTEEAQIYDDLPCPKQASTLLTPKAYVSKMLDICVLGGELHFLGKFDAPAQIDESTYSILKKVHFSVGKEVQVRLLRVHFHVSLEGEKVKIKAIEFKEDLLAQAEKYKLEERYLKAFMYYSLCADLEYPPAQYEVGMMYASGKGVFQSTSEAGAWMKKAANAGHPDAQYQMGYLIREKRRKTAQEIENAKRWLLQAIEQGHHGAELIYASFIENEEEKMKWIYRSAEGGWTEAQSYLAIELHRKRKYNEAAKWFKRASDSGDATSMSLLAGMYEYGQGVEKNIEKARSLYEEAAKKGGIFSTSALEEFEKHHPKKKS